MSVSDKLSGIVDTHIAAIERTAMAMNTFIFIRPTEFDSTILIKAGYATKSMDVHHKSSNWGPMAGFVPCDPAFSKKCEGKPNPNEHEHKHGAAHPVHLGLTQELLNVHEKIEFKTNFLLTAATGGAKLDVPWIAKRQGEKPGAMVAQARGKFEAFQSGGGAIPEHKFCVAKPSEFGNKATTFCLIKKSDKWMVYWIQWEGETGRLYPLRVFGYPQNGTLNPVTGDYDLWMVAPHFSHFDEHAMAKIEKDKHGESAASSFTLSLNKRMNESCGRANNPVFNHGAEAQNYGFTQALDWNLAMFTPGGNSRMVRMNQMPQLLGDLQQAGYLVIWNKRYGETDPRLMSKADSRGNELVQIRAQLNNIYSQLDEIKKTANSGQVAKEFQTSKQMPSAMKAELGAMAERFQATRELGLEQSRIYIFHKQLLNFLGSQIIKSRVLLPVEFPAGYKTYELQAMNLHNELQKAIVAATNGKGDTAEQQLKDWLKNNQQQINTLKDYWKVA